MRLIPAMDLEPQALVAARLASAEHLPFFLGPHWLAALLETVPAAATLHVLEEAGDPIAVLGYSQIRRWRFLSVRQYHLNETGLPGFDGITQEYNGFAAAGISASDDQHRFAWLMQNLANCDELVVRNATVETASALRAAASAIGWKIRRMGYSPAAYLDLEQVRKRGGDPIAGFGKNTRAAIRRSNRLYAGTSGIVAERAETPDQALDWFERMAVLHIASWQRRGQRNAFDFPYFRAFHRALIANAFPAGEIDMLRITAADREIGYLYNFHKDGHTLAYQSGLAEPQDNRWKPGLTCHCAAIGLSLARGDSVYDFLAGPARYKASLADGEIPMESLVAFRPGMLLQLENALRGARQRLRNR